MITKSDYLKFAQCPKYLWLHKNRKDLLPTEADLEAERRFAEGDAVEQLALRLFPGNLSCATERFMDGPRLTQDCLDKGDKILYQPAFLVDDLYARCDIIVRRGDAWDICEIKSATQVKPQHILDLAFQKLVLERARHKVGRLYVLHIDNEYVRQGDIDPKKLLAAEDVTVEVAAKEDEVRKGVAAARRTLAERTELTTRVLKQCADPYECPFIGHCWKNIPDRSIYELRLDEDQLNGLLDRGIVALRDVPEEEVTGKRDHWHWESVRTGQPRVRPEGIAEQLQELRYPLYYLDYEAYNSALPPFDGYRPYQYVPFQYSLHVQDKPGGKLKHFEFLADEFADPVAALGERLSGEIGPTGSVVAWNANFEKAANDLIGARVPKLRRFFERVNARMVDPISIVRSGDFYDGRFGNSASLKAVLPVVAPELSYGDLAIHEGATAMLMWPRLCSADLPKKEREQLRHDMLEYCGRDTEAMVVIVDYLRKLAGLSKG